MATKYAVLRGIQLLQENFSGNGVRQCALCTFDTPAYTASTDLDTMTFSGERDTGTDGSPTLATAIQNQRRDGRTVTLRGGMCVQAGLSTAAAAVYAGFVTTNPIGFMQVSSGNLLASLTNAAGADTTAAATAAPISIVVAYDLSAQT